MLQIDQHACKQVLCRPRRSQCVRGKQTSSFAAWKDLPPMTLRSHCAGKDNLVPYALPRLAGPSAGAALEDGHAMHIISIKSVVMATASEVQDCSFQDSDLQSITATLRRVGHMTPKSLSST